MKFVATLVALILSIALVSGQHFLFGQLPSRASQFNVQPAIGGANVRDPRQDRGPVVFPPSPPDAVDESSGVVVGASGYGFVPPSQSTIFGQSSAYTSILQTPDSAFTSYNYFRNPYTTRFSFY